MNVFYPGIGMSLALPTGSAFLKEVVMARRFKMARGKSRRSFTRGARRVHRKNFSGGNPMRGGIRL